jgi:alkanesulfonate monooxygenase SsuD/methylene tetrahydromethanopterin reductase-like flavin-dependent oxidoreductase (luciferase family)
MSEQKQLILSASIGGLGFHPGAPVSQTRRLVELDHYRQLLRAAERGRLGFVLLEDGRAVAGDRPIGHLDALTVLARLAPETSGVGLVASKPTTYSEPFTVSRELATLDLVSGGRAGWDVTTIASSAEAQNYGEPRALPDAERRAIAAEYVEVSRKLWDSWEDDAIVLDRAGGRYLDPAKLHHINHAGAHFKIRGPQITYRPPQGQLVVVAVDRGDPGVPLSAELADVLILRHSTLATAQQAYAEHRQAAAAAGREVRVLQSVLPILGATADLAQARAAELDARAADGTHALRAAGTPAQVADLLEQWFRAGAADGFHLLPAVLPNDLDQLADELAPELRRRGLLSAEYAGSTLREHLGLARPTSQYAGAPSEAFTAYDS